MATIQQIAVFKDEGIAILEDEEGRFLMFKEQEALVPLADDIYSSIVTKLTLPKPWVVCDGAKYDKVAYGM